MSILPLDSMFMLCEKGKDDNVQSVSVIADAKVSRAWLEYEIMILRSMMESAVAKENSMTSESVILLSRQLDLKLNEYMFDKYKYRPKS